MVPCYHRVLLEELQKVMALAVGMGRIPIPSLSPRACHGHELVGSSGQRSQSWSWSCHQVLCAQPALEASFLNRAKESKFTTDV